MVFEGVIGVESFSTFVAGKTVLAVYLFVFKKFILKIIFVL